MKKRIRRPAPAATPANAGGSSRHRGTLWLCGVLVGVAVLGTVYFWPQHEGTELPPKESTAPALVLPTEPQAMTVEQIREEAEQTVQRLTEKYPQSAGAHRAAATLYQFLNQYEKGIGHWEKCIALSPADAVAREWLAKMQLKHGEDAAATRTLEDAMEAGLDTAEIHHQYTIALQRTNKLAEAEKNAKQALAKYPDHIDLWMALGRAQIQLGRFADAKASFDAALRIDPNSNTAHFAAANACQRLGDAAAAAEHRRHVDEARATRQRGRFVFEAAYERSLREIVSAVFAATALEYDVQGESGEAERWCRRAIELVPTSTEPCRLLANIYHRRGDIGNAFVVQQRLMQLEPANVVNYVNFANLSLQLGRTEEGEAALLEAARESPKNALVRRSLAVLYLQARELANARQAAEQAVRLEPSADGYRLLATVCRQQGDLDAASTAELAADNLQSSTAP